MAAHQLVGVIEFRARQQIEAGRIHQHLRPGTLDHQVIGLRRRIQLEAVLEAAAPSGQHGDAQRGLAALGGDDLGNAGGRPLGQCELFHAWQHRALPRGIEAAPQRVSPPP